MRVAVCMPTRGLVFTEAMEAVLENLYVTKVDYAVFFSNDEPIPDCFNVTTMNALTWLDSKKDDRQYVWYVEEDTVPPANALRLMLETDRLYTCVDYHLADGYGGVYVNEAGDITWTGLGCTLVNRLVFRYLTPPYFRSDITMERYDDVVKIRSIPGAVNVYGWQDVYFCMTIRKQSMKLHCISGLECKHLKVMSPGKDGVNDGTHSIGIQGSITKPRRIWKEHVKRGEKWGIEQLEIQE